MQFSDEATYSQGTIQQSRADYDERMATHVLLTKRHKLVEKKRKQKATGTSTKNKGRKIIYTDDDFDALLEEIMAETSQGDDSNSEEGAPTRNQQPSKAGEYFEQQVFGHSSDSEGIADDQCREGRKQNN